MKPDPAGFSLKRALSSPTHEQQRPEAPAPFQAQTTAGSSCISHLLDLTPAIHSQILGHLNAQHVALFAEALLRADEPRSKLPDLPAAQATLEVEQAPDVMHAISRLPKQLGELDPTVRHRPVAAAITRLASESRTPPCAGLEPALDLLRSIVATLPWPRQGELRRMIDALDPRCLLRPPVAAPTEEERVTTRDQLPQPVFDFLAVRAQDVSRLAQHPVRDAGRRSILDAIVSTADAELRSGSFTGTGGIDAMQRALVALLQRGSRSGTGESPWQAQALFLRDFLDRIDDWHTSNIHGAQRPVLHQALGEALTAASQLPAELRHLARPAYGATRTLLRAYFDSATDDQRASMFDRLVNALPQQQRGEALADLSTVLSTLPPRDAATALHKLAELATTLPASESPVHVLLHLSNMLGDLEPERQAAAAQQLVRSTTRLMERNALDGPAAAAVHRSLEDYIPHEVPPGQREESVDTDADWRSQDQALMKSLGLA